LASSVLVLDDSPKAFPHGGEFVFEFTHSASGVVGFGGAGVSGGYEFAACVVEAGDSGDEFGSFGSIDLGAEVQTKSAAELVILGS
jgi:hypothetical protein